MAQVREPSSPDLRQYRKAHPTTSLRYGNADMVEDLMGKKTFTAVMLMQTLCRQPRPVDLRITDVVLIVLMEHGLTPSAMATRLTYMSAQEDMQGAVAARLVLHIVEEQRDPSCRFIWDTVEHAIPFVSPAPSQG